MFGGVSDDGKTDVIHFFPRRTLNMVTPAPDRYAFASQIIGTSEAGRYQCASHAKVSASLGIVRKVRPKLASRNEIKPKLSQMKRIGIGGY